MLSDFYHSLTSCKTSAAVGVLFVRAIEDEGFVYCAGRSFFPARTDGSFKLLFRNWPEARSAVSDSRGMTAQNAIIREARRRMSPFTWDDIRAAASMTAADAENWEHAMSFGLRNGFVQPIHGPGGYLGVISASTREKATDLRPDWQFRLRLLALCAHDQAANLSGARPLSNPAERLSPRELETLRWVADGKTDKEIGAILAISATTVRFHIDRARLKLEARTRAQAVARMAFFGLL